MKHLNIPHGIAVKMEWDGIFKVNVLDVVSIQLAVVP